ncbi:ABC transporter family substrate-binding protein [Saxibacter everestensis]|uniref:ABC transporter family substrate-binding protein n=1 Tax=Saxibacter everestensis TaxID=2909229 RepID=A0ABY8QQB5_9MICO|nr:ABC transporter family substrate-binding protein [Brevibacteriaceae bacterium ZFBP1038]
MSKRKLLAAGAVFAVGALALSACTPPAGNDDNQSINDESTLSVMWNQPFYSYNNATSNGNATANTNPIYLTNESFAYYDDSLQLHPNKGYGTFEKLSDDPLKVKYTINDNAQWSDGTPVTAADVVLPWAAQSGHFNSVKAEDATNEDGTVKENSGDDVYFDASDPGFSLITKFPEVSEDGKEVTFTYDKPFADWEVNYTSTEPGVPAHVVAQHALGEKDAAKASEALLAAFKDKDDAALSKISNFWNTGFDFTSLPEDKSLLVGNGPYKMTEYKENQFMTLEKNENYKGENKPKVDKITIRYNEDPMAAVQALENGEVDLIQPQSTADVLKAAQAIDGVKVDTGDDATYEHIDLTFNNNGPFDPKKYGGDKEKAKQVRQAFLKAVPRQKIVDTIVKPLTDTAQTRDSFNVVPGSPNYDDTVAANGVAEEKEADIAGAKDLLKQAGVDKPKVRIMYAEGNQRREQEFQLIKESAEEAGFEIIDNGDAKWSEKLGDKTYDASLFGWQSVSTAVTEADANFRSTGQNNFGGYNNPDVDKLYDQLQVETDPEKQKQINIDVEKKLVEDAFGVTLFQFPGLTAYNENVSNVSTITVSPTVFWNFWEWEVK